MEIKEYNYIEMNKASLKKLSKSELIKLLLKQEKKKKPKIIVVNDTKKTNKPKKQKVVHNHDNLFDDTERNVLGRVKTPEPPINTAQNIRYYPLIKTSLFSLRKDEQKRSSSKNKAKMSFIELFERRLYHIEGRSERVSIKLDVEIDANKDVSEEEYERLPKEMIKEGVEKDEYGIKYKKVIKQTLNKEKKYIRKIYGSFAVEKPVNLSKLDIYKFAMYTLLKNKFAILSQEVISGIGCEIIKLTKKQFKNRKMGKLKLESYLLNKQRPITRHGENTCVVDYVWDQVRGQPGFKSYTYDKLKSEIYEFVPEGDMISTVELIDWAKECHNNVSIHAFDARYKKFITHIATNTRTNVVLVYIVKDHHCHPITDEKLKIVASKANQGGCDNLLKYMCDLKWSRRHENVTKIESVEEICSLDKENHIVVIPEKTKMTEAINIYSRSENFYVEYLHWNNNGVLDGFIDHNNNMYLLNEEYNTRKTICDKLFNIYKTHEFKWTNQSYTSIARSLFKQLNGYIPESCYNVNTRQMLDDFYPRALQWCTYDDIPDDVVSIDIAKCYPSILLNNNHEIPLYSIHDVIEPFNCKSDLRNCGEFYIDETVLENYSNPIKIEAGFYSSNLISYLVDELNMPLRQIKYKIITKRALKPDTFSAFFKYIFDTLPEGEAKKIANSFIGDLGRKYNIINCGFTCTEYDTAMCRWTSGLAEGKNMTVDYHDGIFLIREKKIERIFSDHKSINRFVVSEAILKCLQLIKVCHGKESVLYGYNTDGIYISNPEVQFKNKKDVKFTTKKIGRAYVTDSQLAYFEKHYRENMDMTDYKIETGKGCIYNGQAGSGKTTKLCKMVQKADRPLVLAFTNKAIENVKSKLISNGYEQEEANKICRTFDSYFCEWSDGNYHNLSGKTIFIEEFSMVPNKWITKIYHEYINCNITVYMFGDPDQCEPVEGGSQIHYNYLESKTISEMCPRIKTLQYIDKSCRYDIQTHEMLKTFLKHGKISTYFQPIDKKLYKNICYLNSTRIKVNAQCCDQFTKDKRYETVEFKFDNKKETYKVCQNMPVLATTNMKDKNIFNTMEFVIEKIKENKFKVNNEWYDIKEFSESFIPSFCVTVYKYQGADIDEHYNIHDVNRMNKKQLYTALSRTTKIEYIHLNNKEINNKYFNKRQPILELVNSKFNSLYKNGKIYQVTFDNGLVYVGSTCEELETRLKWHLSNMKSQVFKNKQHKPKIELIVNAPSNDKKNLEQVENGYIHEYAEKYGNELINIRSNPNKKTKKIEYKATIENKKQLEERIAKLENKLTIKDDAKNKCWFIDNIIDGKRFKTMARYGKTSKEDALTKINEKKQEKIKELTVYFE